MVRARLKILLYRERRILLPGAKGGLCSREDFKLVFLVGVVGGGGGGLRLNIGL